MSNKSVITPEDGIVISKKWLSKQIFDIKKVLAFGDDDSLEGYLKACNHILENSQPLKPVLEAVTDEVIEIAACHTDCELDKEGTKANANNFLNNPIEIK